MEELGCPLEPLFCKIHNMFLLTKNSHNIVNSGKIVNSASLVNSKHYCTSCERRSIILLLIKSQNFRCGKLSLQPYLTELTQPYLCQTNALQLGASLNFLNLSTILSKLQLSIRLRMYVQKNI